MVNISLFSQEVGKGKNLQSRNNHIKLPRVLAGVVGAGEGGTGGEESTLILYGFLVETGRDLWVSHQSTFITLVLIFFDSHGFSFFPNVFGSKLYGLETELLKNVDKELWKQPLNFAQLYKHLFPV